MLKAFSCFARSGIVRKGLQLRCNLITDYSPNAAHQTLWRARTASLPRRCFHESTLLREEKFDERKLIENKTVQQVTLICPQNVTQKEVLRILANVFRGTERLDPVQNRRLAIMILATPRFVGWLEDNEGFIQNLLKDTAFLTNQKSLVVDVCCACVDGLSPTREGFADARGKPPTEGFSILYDFSPAHFLDPWKPDSTKITNIKSETPSSLLFRWRILKSEERFDITFPLANTLFKNGKVSTLLASRWQLEENGMLSIVRGPVEKQQVALNFHRQPAPLMPRLSTPAIPLTAPREIVNGLGNIVRTIKFDSGPGPASHELEEAVNSYIENSKQGPIDVWALIIPRDVILSSNALSDLSKISSGIGPEKGGWAEPDDSYIDGWLAKGAKVCRVLSGGGGWGAKQGLLSLDPQTHFHDIAETQFDFSSKSVEVEQASALGSMAQEGSFIQFFFTRKTESVLLESPEKKASVSKSHQKWVIGTTPSTIDEIPADNANLQSFEDAEAPSVHVLQGHFGCVTESGLFLDRESYKAPTDDQQELTLPKCVTKIDMPYSYFY